MSKKFTLQELSEGKGARATNNSSKLSKELAMEKMAMQEKITESKAALEKATKKK